MGEEGKRPDIPRYIRYAGRDEEVYLRGNELLTTPAVADTAEQPVQTDNVSIYKFGRSVYKVRTHFNLACKETLADIVGRLILQDLDETDN